MTLVWCWLALNAGFLLGTMWGTRQTVRRVCDAIDRLNAAARN